MEIMDNKDLIEKLTEIFSKGSVNYVEPSPPVDNTDCLKAFNQYAKTELFRVKGLSPIKLPTESTILLGEPLTGKTSIMNAWQELLKNKIEHVKFKRETFRNEDGEWQPVRYYKELELLSSRWIDEKEVRSFYKDVDNLNLPYKNYVVTQYYFLDDFCYQKYEHGKNEFEKAFISYMDRLIRFLELNKNIIIIASTNNKPSEFLGHAGMYARVDAIFKNKIAIGKV